MLREHKPSKMLCLSPCVLQHSLPADQPGSPLLLTGARDSCRGFGKWSRERAQVCPGLPLPSCFKLSICVFGSLLHFQNHSSPPNKERPRSLAVFSEPPHGEPIPGAARAGQQCCATETPGAGQRGSLEPHLGLKNKFPQQPLSRPTLGKPGLCERGLCWPPARDNLCEPAGCCAVALFS